MKSIKIYNPKVSVIVPTYNAEKTIERCIKSLSLQNYDNFEIVVVDDGSSDKTLETLSSIHGQWKMKIIKSEHHGVSAARNIGIKKSSGQYILFLDCDDTLEKNAIKTLVDYAETSKCKIIRFGYNKVVNNKKTRCVYDGLNGKILNTADKKDHDVLIDNFFRNRKSIPCFSVLLFMNRRTIIRNDLFFNEKLYMMEDAVFYLDLFSVKERIYFVSDYLYNYYIHPNSVSNFKNSNIKTAKGALDSSVIILNRFNYDGRAALGYLKIVFSYIARSNSDKREIYDLAFCENMRMIAYYSNVCREKKYWAMIKKAILEENHPLLQFGIIVLRLRDKVRRLSE